MAVKRIIGPNMYIDENDMVVFDIIGSGSQKDKSDFVDEQVLTISQKLGLTTIKGADGSYTISSPELSSDETSVTNIKTDTIQNSTTKINTETKDTFGDILKNNTDSTNSRLDIQNDLITAQIMLQHERNEIETKKVNEMIKSNKLLDSIMKTNVENVAINRLNADYNVASNIMNYYKNDYEINGHDEITNSDGEKIIPMHEIAKHNSEKAIETKAMNETGFGLDDVEDMFDSFELNPFTALIDSVKEEIKNQNNIMYPSEGNINV